MNKMFSLIKTIIDFLKREQEFKKVLYISTINEQFLMASLNGDINTVSEMIAKDNFNQLRYDAALINACANGKINMLQYFITCDKIQHLINLRQEDDYIFIKACESGDLPTIKYLLTCDFIQDKPNVHAQKDAGFIHLCKMGDIEAIRWIIKDYGIILTEDINHFMKTTKCINLKKHQKEINDLFFYQQLQSQLPVNTVQERKRKL